MGLGLGGATTGIVEYALDGLSLRHAAIAANIANANSVGYRPLRVSFEQHLAALDRQPAGPWPQRPLPPPEVSLGLPVELSAARRSGEADVVELNRNVLQYQALIKGLDKYLASLATAINEGRR